MIRLWLATAAIGGFLSVAAGAFALLIAGWGFAAGMALFSLSFFAPALTGIGWLGLVTPFGGLGLLVGWAAVGLHAFHRR